MEFYTAFNEKRPIRLNAQTREFAWESLHGRYGEESLRTPVVAVDDIIGFERMTEYGKYDAAIARIAEMAPIRICEFETVSGAATLGGAIDHVVPAFWRGGKLWDSVSHVTLGFGKVLETGIDGIAQELILRLADPALGAPQIEILESMRNTIGALRVWHKRYLEALARVKPAIHGNLIHVPFKPARHFHEAVQSLWFVFAFERLCGNWPGIGRIDEMLGGFLKRDLASGVLTLDEAREILAGFFIKGCEWIRRDIPEDCGDAHHYQNIVLSGMDVDGQDVTNEVTYLVLDIVEELGIGDFPVSVRIGGNTPEKLLTRMAEVIRHGGGIVAAYNEPLILKSLTEFGYSTAEARRFANDGCWEVQVPGKTHFGYYPFDSLKILLNDTLGLNGTPALFDDFGSLYAKYLADLKRAVEGIYRDTVRDRTGQLPGADWHWRTAIPCSAVSMLTEGCIESGLSYLGGGARYNVMSPHIGGAPDAGNSLYAIHKLVFEERKVSFSGLMAILQSNWEGQEALRQYVLNQYTYYGNDHDEADAFTCNVLNDFAGIVAELKGRCPILFPAGVSTFGRQIEWAPFRTAVPFGRRKGDILSSNTSPTPGTDSAGATAMIRSYCKADLSRQANGAALDVKLHHTAVQGENGVESLVALLKGFVALGGFFLQPDVVDATVLRLAQANPEDYKTLSVRVSGWNARFVTLGPEWQEMVIERTAQGV